LILKKYSSEAMAPLRINICLMMSIYRKKSPNRYLY